MAVGSELVGRVPATIPTVQPVNPVENELWLAPDVSPSVPRLPMRYMVYDDNGIIRARDFSGAGNHFEGAAAAGVLQSAFDATRVGGGAVYVSGKLTLASRVVLWPGVGLRGDGFLAAGVDQDQPGSVLVADPALNDAMIVVKLDPANPGRYSFPMIENIVINGNNTAARASQDGVLVDASNGNVLDLYISNVGFFNHGGNGLNATSPNQKVFVDNCYFENCKANGIRVNNGTVRVIQSYFFGNSLMGIEATSAGLLSVMSSWFVSNVQGALDLWSNGAGFIITSNQFLTNGGGTYPQMHVKQGNAATGCVLNSNVFGDGRSGGAQATAHVAIGANGSTKFACLGNHFSGIVPAFIVTARAGYKVNIANNVGFNDTYGKITNPFHTANVAIGIAGSAAAPAASTAYVASLHPVYVASTAGVGVSITISDPAGNVIQSGLATYAGVLPCGWSINFGAFTGAPTVVVAVA